MLFAIEGQNPTPKFIPPDFSVEEERVAYPSDLLEFFKIPFIDYLRSDASKDIIETNLEINSSKGALGSIIVAQKGFVAKAKGSQDYYGDGETKKMLRVIEGHGGYADILDERFPFALKSSGAYSSFRGEYELSTYSFSGGAEGHMPIGKSLISMDISGTRESWAQHYGHFPRIESPDIQRAEISNAVSGKVAFRSMPGEYTGFEIITSGVTSTRYRQNKWNIKRTVTSGVANLVYDSKSLRLSVGASAHRTWEETIISPSMDFELNWRQLSTFASIEGYTVPIERYKVFDTPRAAIPNNADFITVPISVTVGGRFELKPEQILSMEAKYSKIENEPILWEPLSEAPMSELEQTGHQSINLSLSSNFGLLKNKLTINLNRDTANDRPIPIEPEEVFSDTVFINIHDITLIAAGYRRYGQPYIGKPQETNIGFGIKYSYKLVTFGFMLQNILGEPIFDERALEFSEETKLLFSLSIQL